MRPTGLGIFIFNSNSMQPLAIYIKAKSPAVSSVLMAEATALSLAAKVVRLLHIGQVNYFSDNEILVKLLQRTMPSSHQDWRLKPLLTLFADSNINIDHHMFKIPRAQNLTAHSLVSQARKLHTQFVCTSASHGNYCPVKEALHFVSWDQLDLLHVKCC